MRTWARGALEQVSSMVGSEVSDTVLKRDAWIVAPHPDDEVLGCGGTIARKVMLGAKVRIVFLTDGSRSHAQWIGGDTLRMRRREEARAACEVLGVLDGDVTFLDFPDGGLTRHIDAASLLLSALLARAPEAEVYAPSFLERIEDHRAACRIARAAIAKCSSAHSYREYSVWGWNEWPWVEAPHHRRGARRLAWVAQGLHRSTTLAARCRTRVAVQHVLHRKLHALTRHASQMRGVGRDSSTLLDVSGGEFVRQCFRPHEVFQAYAAHPSPVADGLDALGTGAPPPTEER